MKHFFPEVLINIIFWIATGWLIVNSLSVTGQEVLIENGIESVTYIRDDYLYQGLLLLIVLSFISFYLHLWNILAHPGRSKKSLTIIIGVLLLITPGLVIEMAEIVSNAPALRIPFTFEYGIYLFYFSCSTGYGVVKLFIQSEQSKKSLLLDKKKAELSLLRSQLQPHFLFNALNNLLAMVDQERDPKLAIALDQLSELLRYVVYDTQSDKVPIQKEIEFIRAYAQLHQLRFDEEEVTFELEVHGDQMERFIEPGILIPFVENAFKYGVLPEMHSKIHIEIDLRHREFFLFRCTNPIYRELLRKEGMGAGLKNVEERLRLSYSDQYSLQVSTNQFYRVELKIHCL